MATDSYMKLTSLLIKKWLISLAFPRIDIPERSLGLQTAWRQTEMLKSWCGGYLTITETSELSGNCVELKTMKKSGCLFAKMFKISIPCITSCPLACAPLKTQQCNSFIPTTRARISVKEKIGTIMCMNHEWLMLNSLINAIKSSIKIAFTIID